ncbi:phospholipase A2 inhibitor gamma subunit B-like [Orcinus orca]|uniref:phospholipase A2 inhibitor gamma subunit B-like n=1 Tax=Orcinus orca TaxID=9733 RepID=UPI0021138B70|nr:phospholipase A2 inhibitor gamma subunit B-like [Orcinus orca]
MLNDIKSMRGNLRQILGASNSVSWRNGSCVASKDCTSDNSIFALTYSIGFGFRVNTTCCQGNCQEPPPLATLPASGTLSKFLCPTCPGGHSGPCNHFFYMQCPSGETECVQMNLVSEEGGRNLSVRGCGTRDLCQIGGLPTLPGHRLARWPVCSTSQRAVLDSECHSGAAPGPRLALPVLMVALGTVARS